MNLNFSFGDEKINEVIETKPPGPVAPKAPVDPELAEGLAYREKLASGLVSSFKTLQYKALRDKYVREMFSSGNYPTEIFLGIGFVMTLAAAGVAYLQYFMEEKHITLQNLKIGYIFAATYLTIPITVLMSIFTESPHWVRATFAMNIVTVSISGLYGGTFAFAIMMPCGYGNISRDCPQASLIYYSLIPPLTSLFLNILSMAHIMFLRKALYKAMEKFGYPPRNPWY